MKDIVISILSFMQFMFGLTSLHLFLDEQEWGFDKIEYGFGAMLIIIPAIKSIDRFWESKLK